VDLDSDVTDSRNAYTLGRITKRLSDRSSFEVQAYYDYVMRNDAARSEFQSDTADLSAQHTFGIGERNDVIWGLGYRYNGLEVDETTTVARIRDGEVRSRIFSAFIQDEFHLVPDKLELTGGVKVEHNDYTGVELQPSVRGVFKPTVEQTVWAAVSRAVRTPSALEGRDVFAITTGAPFTGPLGLSYVPRLVGNDELDSEVAWTYELGYRVQPTRRVSVDMALFYNAYDNLVAPEGVSNFVIEPAENVAEVPFRNTDGGRSYGGELSVAVSLSDSWRVSASYSWLMVDLPGSAPGNPYERASPRNQVVLRSSHEFSRRLSMDAQLRYVDTIQFVPAYLTADLRFAYRVTDRLEVALVGQNLLDNQHPEQAPFFLTTTSDVPRSFHLKATWHF
jgi:iron complex outermembrane receptor protein